MKKVVSTVLTVLAIGLIAMNLNVKEKSVVQNDLTLENIESLQASAGEMYCDQKNQEDCTITQGDVTGKSKGYLIAVW